MPINNPNTEMMKIMTQNVCVKNMEQILRSTAAFIIPVPSVPTYITKKSFICMSAIHIL